MQNSIKKLLSDYFVFYDLSAKISGITIFVNVSYLAFDRYSTEYEIAESVTQEVVGDYIVPAYFGGFDKLAAD